MQQARHYMVYGLVDPETKQLRYVGRSVNGFYRARAPHGHWCENWRQSLIARGLKPEIIVIEKLDIPSIDLLNEREQFWIAHYRAQGAPLTNITDGGDGRRAPLSEEHKAKLLAANLGAKRAPEVGEKIAASKRGKPRDAATRAKISASLRGKAWSEARRSASVSRQ